MKIDPYVVVKKNGISKAHFAKICQKVIYMLWSTSPVDSACSHFESARECQRSTSPILSTAEFILILFFIWFCCEFSSWFPSPTLETTVKNFPSKNFSNHLFIDHFPSAVFKEQQSVSDV